MLSRTTLARLHSASQQLLIAGRVTTGAKAFRGAAATHAGAGASAALAGHDVLTAAGSSDRRFGDGAAVAALKGAALLDPAAPLTCPAALLLDVAGDDCADARPSFASCLLTLGIHKLMRGLPLLSGFSSS